MTKKVALAGLILTLIAGSLQAQNREYPLSKETKRRFEKITGKPYKPNDSRQRRSTEEVPDYSRPSNLIEMGVRFAPNLNVNTAEGNGAFNGFKSNGAGLRFSTGLNLDYFFYKDRYALSSGLWYTIFRSGYQMPGTFGQGTFNPGAPTQESAYNLRYVQVPVTVKLFANNLFPQARVYFQTGGIINVKVGERALDQARNGLYKYAEATNTSRQYGFADVAFLVGGGVQFKLNDINAVNVGLIYQRGLLDVARGGDLFSKSRVVSLDLGFKF
ncbi:MAG: PorT family protein [Bacteroidetes bacterium]|nr:PorT family protein [Fibrella sp.]